MIISSRFLAWVRIRLDADFFMEACVNGVPLHIITIPPFLYGENTV